MEGIFFPGEGHSTHSSAVTQRNPGSWVAVPAIARKSLPEHFEKYESCFSITATYTTNHKAVFVR